MHEKLTFRPFLVPMLFLLIIGWGGLWLMLFIFDLTPLVWARWGFFALWFMGLTGIGLPFAFFFNLRFPSHPPAEPNVIVRQSLWLGVYGSTLAWLQLGRLVTLWAWMGLAAGLIMVEYLIRLREQARWHPPTPDLEPDEPPEDETSVNHEQSSDTSIH